MGNDLQKNWKYSISSLPTNHCYNFMDVFKFICAILIVIIHVQIFSSGESKALDWVNLSLYKYIARIAVPFFFVASGFFLFRKVEVNNPDIKTVGIYLAKNLKVFAIWSIILIFGQKFHLWYMQSLVVAVGIVFLLLKLGLKPKIIFLISTILYAIGLFGDSYYGIIKDIEIINNIFTKYFLTTRNGIFMGMSFVSMGLLFAKCNICLSKVTCCLGLISSCALMAVEVVLLCLYDVSRDYNMYIFLQPVTFFIFYFVTHLELKDRPIYSKLRKMGILIYCSHLFFNYVAIRGQKLLRTAFLFELPSYLQQPVIFILTIAMTVLFAWIVEKIADKHKAVRWFYT